MTNYLTAGLELGRGLTRQVDAELKQLEALGRTTMNPEVESQRTARAIRLTIMLLQGSSAAKLDDFQLENIATPRGCLGASQHATAPHSAAVALPPPCSATAEVVRVCASRVTDSALYSISADVRQVAVQCYGLYAQTSAERAAKVFPLLAKVLRHDAPQASALATAPPGAAARSPPPPSRAFSARQDTIRTA